MLEQEAEEGAFYARSVARCSTTIRSLLRAADPLLLIEAHITFARLEARIGRFDVARRHLSRCEQLLTATHNICFSADRLLTEGAVLAAQGDLPSALRMTAEAHLLSVDCGWIKGESIAAGNLAVFNVGAGNADDAQKYLAEAMAGDYHTPSLDYALLDTAALIALRRRDEVAADA